MDDINSCYVTLGLHPGASPEQVKQAYRDLVNVWHPDRFSHDSRLQTRAQEKLSEINRAYERLEAFIRDAGYRAPEPPPPEEPERPPHNAFQEQLGIRPRKSAPRELAHELDAALERYESKLRSKLAKVGYKLPPLSSEGRIKGLLVLCGALYLLLTVIYILVVI